MSIIETPPLTYVSWGCTRCGFTGGVANTTFPIDFQNEVVWREVFATLRRKLQRVHQAQRGCMATMEDLTVGPYRPPKKTIVGVV